MVPETSKNYLKCKILIDKQVINGSLNGQVQIISDYQIPIQHAVIEVSGIASCHWLADKNHIQGDGIYPRGSVFESFEQFYYIRRNLCGGEVLHLHSGNEHYGFECYWPSRLPGTWLGEYGYIKYLGRVTIKTDKDVYIHNQEILVKFKRDLTAEDHLLFESRVDVERSYFGTKSMGKIFVSIWIPISGISAGQSLPVFCSVYNNSKINFGGLLFVLTRIDIYKSDKPRVAVKKVRTDICRVARMVNVHRGKYEYYAVLHTNKDTIPTNQFYKCTCYQVIYEVWVSVQGAIPHNKTFGYPNIDTPGIPIIIGTKPLVNYDANEITAKLLKKMFDYTPPLFTDELPEDVKRIIDETGEELQEEAVIANLERQLEENERALSDLRTNTGSKEAKFIQQ